MKITIIGAGISGLTAAYYLHSLGKENNTHIDIEIFEKSSRAGGNISTKTGDGFIIEEGADSFITSKPWAVELCRKLGIENKLIPTNDSNRKTYIYFDGSLNELPEGFFLMAPSNIEAFKKSKFFSEAGKERILQEQYLPPRKEEGDESLESFVLRRFGAELLEKVAQPLIGGIYTGDPSRLSMKSILPEFTAMEQQYGSVIKGISEKYGPSNISKTESGARYGMFVSFRNGLSELISAILESIPGLKINYKTKIEEISKSGEGWQLVTDSGAESFTDALILAGPSYVSSKLLSNADSKLSAQLNKIKYESSVVINLVYEKEKCQYLPEGFGVVVPKTEGMNIIACSFSSHKFSDRTPENYEIIRCFLGGAFHKNIVGLNDSRLLELVVKDLETLFKISAGPHTHDIYRYPDSMPQYTIGYSELLEEIRAEMSRYPLLALSGNAYGGVGIPDSIKSGKEAAHYIFRNLTN